MQLAISNVFNIQWGHTGNIPGIGGLIVTLPTSCEEALFSVVATMFNNATNAHRSRLMVSEFQKTLFIVDWSDGTYIDPVVWISVGT